MGQIQSIFRWQISITKTVISVFDRVENTLGKGENAGYQQLSFVFKSLLSQGH